VSDVGVQLGQPLLVLLEVVEGAVMRLCMLMLHTEDIRAFAWHFDQSYLLRAQPALIRVRL
jgi:hypothetical protein